MTIDELEKAVTDFVVTKVAEMKAEIYDDVEKNIGQVGMNELVSEFERDHMNLYHGDMHLTHETFRVFLHEVLLKIVDLDNFFTKKDFDEAMKAYYTKTAIDELLAKYVTTETYEAKVSDIESRLDTDEDNIATNETDIDDLQSRMTTAESNITSINETDATQDASIADLGVRINELENRDITIPSDAEVITLTKEQNSHTMSTDDLENIKVVNKETSGGCILLFPDLGDTSKSFTLYFAKENYKVTCHNVVSGISNYYSGGSIVTAFWDAVNKNWTFTEDSEQESTKTDDVYTYSEADQRASIKYKRTLGASSGFQIDANGFWYTDAGFTKVKDKFNVALGSGSAKSNVIDADESQLTISRNGHLVLQATDTNTYIFSAGDSPSPMIQATDSSLMMQKNGIVILNATDSETGLYGSDTNALMQYDCVNKELLISNNGLGSLKIKKDTDTTNIMELQCTTNIAYDGGLDTTEQDIRGAINELNAKATLVDSTYQTKCDAETITASTIDTKVGFAFQVSKTLFSVNSVAVSTDGDNWRNIEVSYSSATSGDDIVVTLLDESGVLVADTEYQVRINYTIQLN